MITADCHLHTQFSTDSEAPMKSMIEAAIEKGLRTVCFTEHLDYDYPPEDGKEGPPIFLVDMPAYQKTLFELRERYQMCIRDRREERKCQERETIPARHGPAERCTV